VIFEDGCSKEPSEFIFRKKGTMADSSLLDNVNSAGCMALSISNKGRK
jgi:hypothetical protein